MYVLSGLRMAVVVFFLKKSQFNNIFKLNFCKSFKRFIRWDFQIMELGSLGTS